MYIIIIDIKTTRLHMTVNLIIQHEKNTIIVALRIFQIISIILTSLGNQYC